MYLKVNMIIYSVSTHYACTITCMYTFKGFFVNSQSIVKLWVTCRVKLQLNC